MNVSRDFNQNGAVMLTSLAMTIRGEAIPFSVFTQVISKVPKGKVVVDNQVIAILRRAYDDDKLEYEVSPKSSMALFNESFPYWRIVAPGGYLTSFDPFHSRDWQRRKLEEEGLEIERDNGGSLKVSDFDMRCFDIANAVVLQRFL